MDDGPTGMVVYRRGTDRRGVVTSTDYTRNVLTVKWDDGVNGLHHVEQLMSEKLYLEMKNEERMKEMALKPEQAVVGAVVYQPGHKAPLTRGKIIAPLGEHNTVVVEWHGGHIQRTQPHLLLSEADGLKENQRLVDEAEKLEREFEQVQAECASKLSKAAQLIREATDLADSKGESLSEMHDAAYDLMRALDNAGWRTSSLGC